MKQKFTLLIAFMLIIVCVSAQEIVVPGNKFKVIDHDLLLHQEKSECNNNFLQNASYKKPMLNSEWLATEESVFLLDSVIGYSLNSDNDSLFYSRKINVYDANGNQTLREEYDWNNDLNDWVGSWKFESSYDANGYPTLSNNL